jgi:tRNA/tmRNA/rRNA uracil-C5-methylase (TrmA/RlmC/RlmD family)
VAPSAPDPSQPEITLTIHDLARGGAGVARDESGRIVFVPYTAPGDRVRARILEPRDARAAKKNYAQAELIEVIEPSPSRVRPPCPVFGRCGGCQWQHLPYELQWRTKVAGVAHALKRVQVELPGPMGELPAERVWNYRNRVQLRGEGHELGFFAAGTHERVPVAACAIARPEINAVWEQVREEGARLPRPYKVEVEALPDGSIRKSWNAPHGAQGFRQVHDEQNEKLKAWVADRIAPGGKLLDLYGGAGNLSLGLAGKMASIDCVDVGSPRGPGPGPSYRFHRSAVAPWVERQASAVKNAPTALRYGSAVLDPPREGLAEDFGVIARSLEELGVAEIVAVGCDPDAWARDVSRFIKRGWRLEEVAVLDLFPQTPHVESLALLRRN